MSQQNLKEPLVSISMPAFNAEKYIAESIESILNQSYANFELIVVDDGSNDQTLSIIKSYEKRDSRIKAYSMGSNVGLANVRNFITGVAQGKYIALLDSDDLCSKSRLVEQIKLLEAGEYDVCASEYFTLDMSNGKKRHRHRYENDADLKALMTIYNPICNSTAVMPRDILNQFSYRENLSGGPEDYDLWVRLAIAGYRFKTIRLPLVTYRLHPDQISKQKESLMIELFDEIRLKYVQFLNLEFIPYRMPFAERLNHARTFMKRLNSKISGVSASVNREIYARFQYKGNGLLTPLVRLERLIASFVLKI